MHQNTYQAIQSTFRSLEMHSKRRYKICICLVIQGNLTLIEITRASVIFFLKFRCILKFKESKNFSDFSLYRIFESENFKGSLLYEKLPKVGSEKRKIILQKIVENLLDKLRKFFVRGKVVQNFQPSLRQRKFQAIFASPKRYFYRKQSLRAPLFSNTGPGNIRNVEEKFSYKNQFLDAASYGQMNMSWQILIFLGILFFIALFLADLHIKSVTLDTFF